MSLNNILKKLDVFVSDKELSRIKKESHLLIKFLSRLFIGSKIDAGAFLGGSIAKETSATKDNLDVDIFIRLKDKKDFSILANLLQKKLKGVKKIHGSRDYFQLHKEGILFELIPVLKISSPNKAENSTDLSYFHVKYLKKRLNKNLKREVIIAKSFCKSQGIYGAESYISGFSGYGLECLILHFKSFEKMAKKLVNVKDKLIIDPEKHYKNKNDILININKSKTHSPIILIDPTFKERNVLAALSPEAFEKFQESLKLLLKSPSPDFFKTRELNFSKFKEKNKSLKNISIKIETSKQQGDISATKMKKFSKFLEKEISKQYEIKETHFTYSGKNYADFFVALIPKKEIIKKGPPLSMIKQVKSFKKENKNIFTKDSFIYSRQIPNPSPKSFLKNFVKRYSKIVSEMDISNISVGD